MRVMGPHYTRDHALEKGRFHIVRVRARFFSQRRRDTPNGRVRGFRPWDTSGGDI